MSAISSYYGKINGIWTTDNGMYRIREISHYSIKVTASSYGTIYLRMTSGVRISMKGTCSCPGIWESVLPFRDFGLHYIGELKGLTAVIPHELYLSYDNTITSRIRNLWVYQLSDPLLRLLNARQRDAFSVRSWGHGNADIVADFREWGDL